MSKKYIRPEDAVRQLKVSSKTLRLWSDEGKIEYIRTAGGHRRYCLDSILLVREEKNIEIPIIKTGKSICYCRVSSYGQKEDLERQVKFFSLKYPDHFIIKEIGSGLNFKRKGFNSILDFAIKGNIKEIVVTHKDRLCRFGFDLVERIIKDYSNGKIVVLNQEKTSPEKELVDDLISIVTVFSSRLYGLRSNSIKKKIKQEAERKLETECEDPQDSTISK
jgi:predicted site-specific integrase-resolvase